MKKYLTMFLVATFLASMIGGCATGGTLTSSGREVRSDYNKVDNYQRFTVVPYTNNIEIITDTYTGYQYLVYRTPSGTGLTFLETEHLEDTKETTNGGRHEVVN